MISTAIIILLCSSVCKYTAAAVAPLSLSVLSLLGGAGVMFNFSSKNSFHQATWITAPSGISNAGIIEFSRTTQEMDLSQWDTHIHRD